jgi:demethylmenaquinone methyltransferase/2-methoxy-6-polyprenyl-1,4-benzoquinol methylase
MGRSNKHASVGQIANLPWFWQIGRLPHAAIPSVPDIIAASGPNGCRGGGNYLIGATARKAMKVILAARRFPSCGPERASKPRTERPAEMTNDVLEYEPGVARVFQSKHETKAFYNKIAKVYDLLAEHSERAVRQEGLAMFAPAAGEHLLEIGVGTGHCLVEIAEAVGPRGRAYGIDISENMLARTQSLLDDERLADRAELVCGDAERLPYASGSMDGIFMSFTLELFDTPEIPQVLEECRRVLRPGGRVAVVGVSKEGKPGMVLRAFEWTHRHFPNLVDCRPIYVRRALNAAGFHVEVWSMRHMWVPVEIVRGRKPAISDDRVRAGVGHPSRPKAMENDAQCPAAAARCPSRGSSSG